MLPLFAHTAFTFPIEDPILKFMLILVIILAAPLILNKLKIPYLLGLIIAGAVIGPHGLNLVLRDSSIILSGTAGLLYIMFLSGLDMEMSDLRRNGLRSGIFGLLTFALPLAFGFGAGYWLLGMNVYASSLMAVLFASHTLIAYPTVSKLGISRDKAVTITVGGTVITDTLALLLLTVTVGMATGVVDDGFWWRLSGSVVGCIIVIMLLFPWLAHWFFKQVSDSISQYIFVLVLVFLGSFLAQMAGLEPIIGAFLSGLALNRLIPRTSPLMNRIEFVGHAIFIPFFLIGVGMLIDWRAFIRDWQTLEVAAVMIVLVSVSKYLAAWITQRSFRLSRDQRTLIFGLSEAHVAATLAAATVGYNVIIGHADDGTPVRLLGESVLNGTIIMILATCTISTFATQRGAHNIAMQNTSEGEEQSLEDNHILIPMADPEQAEELVNMGLTLRPKRDRSGIFALHAIDNKIEDMAVEKRARKLLDSAASAAAAGDIHLQTMIRYDVNISNAIVSVVRERNISDIVMGMHPHAAVPAIAGIPIEPVIGRVVADVLAESNATTMLYHPRQPLSTIKRHLVVVPEHAEQEAGFAQWMQRIHTLARNTGAKVVVFAPESTMQYISSFGRRQPSNIGYVVFGQWDNLPSLEHDLRDDDCLWFVMSRRDRLSYHPSMSRMPQYIEQVFAPYSCVLVYPSQAVRADRRYF